MYLSPTKSSNLQKVLSEVFTQYLYEKTTKYSYIDTWEGYEDMTELTKSIPYDFTEWGSICPAFSKEELEEVNSELDILLNSKTIVYYSSWLNEEVREWDIQEEDYTKLIIWDDIFDFWDSDSYLDSLYENICYKTKEYNRRK